MQQVRFWLRVCPDPTGEANIVLPDPLAGGEGACCSPLQESHPSHSTLSAREFRNTFGLEPAVLTHFSLPTLACLCKVLQYCTMLTDHMSYKMSQLVKPLQCRGKVICVPVALPASTSANTPKIPLADRILMDPGHKSSIVRTPSLSE